MIGGTILLLCAVGLYASGFMLRKSLRAARGQLAEPSVVETARAKVVGGVPNAAVGLLYYAAVAASVPFLSISIVWIVAFAASLCAAAMSAYLAYSLLFVTKMPCAYCWTAHATNALIAVLLLGHRLG